MPGAIAETEPVVGARVVFKVGPLVGVFIGVGLGELVGDRVGQAVGTLRWEEKKEDAYDMLDLRCDEAIREQW